MPPASLSTFAVMNPGPMTAKNSIIRFRQLFGISLMDVDQPAMMPQHRDHIIGGDDARNATVLVDDRKGDQVVLVEELGHLIVGCVGRAGHVGLAQIPTAGQPATMSRFDQGNGPGQFVRRLGEVIVAECLARAFERLERFDRIVDDGRFRDAR